MMSEHDDKNKVELNAEAATPDNDREVGGEDDSSTEIEGDDSHLHEDQKSRRLSSAVDTSKKRN